MYIRLIPYGERCARAFVFEGWHVSLMKGWRLDGRSLCVYLLLLCVSTFAIYEGWTYTSVILVFVMLRACAHFFEGVSSVFTTKAHFNANFAWLQRKNILIFAKLLCHTFLCHQQQKKHRGLWINKINEFYLKKNSTSWPAFANVSQSNIFIKLKIATILLYAYDVSL